MISPILGLSFQFSIRSFNLSRNRVCNVYNCSIFMKIFWMVSVGTTYPLSSFFKRFLKSTWINDNLETYASSVVYNSSAIWYLFLRFLVSKDSFLRSSSASLRLSFFSDSPPLSEATFGFIFSSSSLASSFVNVEAIEILSPT